MFVYIYTQVTRVCQDTPHHMTGTFNKHLSLAIFDKHLVRQTNQGWPKILPQYPLETALTVILIWQLNNNLPNSYKFTTHVYGIYRYFTSAYHTYIYFKNISTWQNLLIISLVFCTM